MNRKGFLFWDMKQDIDRERLNCTDDFVIIVIPLDWDQDEHQYLYMFHKNYMQAKKTFTQQKLPIDETTLNVQGFYHIIC